MKKILLINPPVSIYINKTAFLPLPLLVLGACLSGIREKGYDITHEVVDLDLMLKKGIFIDDSSFYQQSVNFILKNKPDILLFTVHGGNHIVVLKLVAMLKKELPSCVTVVGGVGPTLQAKEALHRCPDIDFIVKGEGETPLQQLIPALLTDQNFSNIPSIVYRENGEVIDNPRSKSDKTDTIQPPDYSLVSVEQYIEHNKTNPYIHPGFVLIESGRGCPYNCSFCAPAKMWNSNVRYRPVQEIINEMKFLAEKGGDFTFFTQDNLEEGFLKSLSHALIKEDSSISWGCYSRLDRLPPDMADLLSKAGCKLIFTGFETPNRSTQKKIRKVTNSQSTFDKMQIFNGKGIQFIGSFIAGFDNESDEDFNNTMHFANLCATGLNAEELESLLTTTDQNKLPQKSKNICSIHPLCYMPGTDSFEEEKEKLHISKYSLHPDCYGSYIFGYSQYKDDWSYLGINPYLNHLPEEKVRYYCSILRLFNFLNNRPFYLALLMMNLKLSPLALMKKMASQLDEEFVLTANIYDFEGKARNYIKNHLDFVPEWTVKKGQ